MVNEATTHMPVVGDFRAFYLAEFPALVGLAASVSGDPSEAEDLVQEALQRAHDRWTDLASFDNPGTWVRRVVINLALNRRRGLGRRSRAVLRMGPPVASAYPEESDPALWKAVAALPDQQRAAVVLHYLEDRPVAEIAEILECSPSTARVHLHKARQNLQRALDAEEIR